MTYDEPGMEDVEFGLFLCDGPHPRQSLPLHPGQKSWTLGRHPSAEIILRESTLAGRHAFVHHIGSTYSLEITGRNGALLHNKFILADHCHVPITPGAWIQLGNTTLLFDRWDATYYGLSPVKDLDLTEGHGLNIEQAQALQTDIQLWKLAWAHACLSQEYKRQQHESTWEDWSLEANHYPWRRGDGLEQRTPPSLWARTRRFLGLENPLTHPHAPPWTEWLLFLDNAQTRLQEGGQLDDPDLQSSLELWRSQTPYFPTIPGCERLTVSDIDNAYFAQEGLSLLLAQLLLDVFLSACSPPLNLFHLSRLVYGVCTYKALVQNPQTPDWTKVDTPPALARSVSVEEHADRWCTQYAPTVQELLVPKSALSFVANLDDPNSVEAGMTTYHQMLTEWNRFLPKEPTPEQTHDVHQQWEDSLFQEP
ncbi:MAG: hypothetical protein EP343_21395 [Deltaproteobacteria bacterium]|nr:MAG: hypothetical protein EP343_21395 [Deltaproteobacteria bacterium]